MEVYVHDCATLLTTAYNPEAIYPSGTLMVLAILMGWAVYKKNVSIVVVTTISFTLTLLAVWFGTRLPIIDLDLNQWKAILLIYSFAASVLPVWLLLQPRDYINSLLLYLGLAAIFFGFFLLQPEFAAPAVQSHPKGAPPLFPFVFVIIACGAVSGFHGLVSSGTTAKQINKVRSILPDTFCIPSSTLVYLTELSFLYYLFELFNGRIKTSQIIHQYRTIRGFCYIQHRIGFFNGTSYRLF